MESRQVVALIGAFVLFIGVFTPVVSVPTVGYMNYFQTAKVDGVAILGLAILSVVLLLAKQYRGLWFTGTASLGVLAFTFISLQIRISEIKDNLGVELAGNRSPSLTDLVVQSVQIQWGWPLLTIGAVFILCAAAGKFVSELRPDQVAKGKPASRPDPTRLYGPGAGGKGRLARTARSEDRRPSRRP